MGGNFETRQSQRTEGRMNHQRFSIVLTGMILSLLILFGFAPKAAAQDWFRTGTGLGVSKPRVAVADFVPRAQPAQALATLFSDVVRNDLDFSGIIELASKSFYPTQPPTALADLNVQV